ncbi:MAG: TetR/AcrR family transcriptional regulator [Solirubrobacterales bacterium]
MADSRSELEDLRPLPRGRHGLNPEEVAGHQRERIALAVATVIAEQGYDQLTVKTLIDVAGVSRSTFYVHFANKQEAILAAHQLIFERFNAELSEACVADGEWTQKVRAALAATVEFARANPHQSRMLSAGSLNVDAAVAEQIIDFHDRLAVLLAGLRPASPYSAELPPVTEQFLVAGIVSLLSGAVIRGETEKLPSLEAELFELVLIPYFGNDEAARLAKAAT